MDLKSDKIDNPASDAPVAREVPTRAGEDPGYQAVQEEPKSGVQPAPSSPASSPDQSPSIIATAWRRLLKFFKFLGPGAVVSVAYLDPDNYETAVAAGSTFEYKLLFMILVSNVIAIFLQSLAVKLGTVTGMDLAQMNNRYLPRWLDLVIYGVAEACIICTDVGQVIGTAIALNILIPALPVPAACAISLADTLIVLLFLSPSGSLRNVRWFEFFMALFVAGVFVTICIALSGVSEPAGEILKGYLPSRDIFVSTGLYQSCAILGGTLMPHALYVGTSVSRPRLLDYDLKYNLTTTSPDQSTESLYRPSLRAIQSCLSYSIAELAVTLFVVAVFVNSAMVVISGASFFGSDNEVEEDLYSLYELFSNDISRTAGTLFVLSLLFSAVSAGVVATVAGQIVMEGALDIRLSPFLRRLLTRCVAIVPAFIIAVSVGREGLGRALVACNYVLAVGLIPITFPLVWYTCRDKYMRVPSDGGTGSVSLKNGLVVGGVAWLIYALVVVMDVATLVLVGLGLTDD